MIFSVPTLSLAFDDDSNWQSRLLLWSVHRIRADRNWRIPHCPASNSLSDLCDRPAQLAAQAENLRNFWRVTL